MKSTPGASTYQQRRSPVTTVTMLSSWDKPSHHPLLSRFPSNNPILVPSSPDLGRHHDFTPWESPSTSGMATHHLRDFQQQSSPPSTTHLQHHHHHHHDYDKHGRPPPGFERHRPSLLPLTLPAHQYEISSNYNDHSLPTSSTASQSPGYFYSDSPHYEHCEDGPPHFDNVGFQLMKDSTSSQPHEPLPPAALQKQSQGVGGQRERPQQQASHQPQRNDLPSHRTHHRTVNKSSSHDTDYYRNTTTARSESYFSNPSTQGATTGQERPVFNNTNSNNGGGSNFTDRRFQQRRQQDMQQHHDVDQVVDNVMTSMDASAIDIGRESKTFHTSDNRVNNRGQRNKNQPKQQQQRPRGSNTTNTERIGLNRAVNESSLIEPPITSLDHYNQRHNDSVASIPSMSISGVPPPPVLPPPAGLRPNHRQCNNSSWDENSHYPIQRNSVELSPSLKRQYDGELPHSMLPIPSSMSHQYPINTNQYSTRQPVDTNPDDYSNASSFHAGRPYASSPPFNPIPSPELNPHQHRNGVTHNSCPKQSQLPMATSGLPRHNQIQGHHPRPHQFQSPKQLHNPLSFSPPSTPSFVGHSLLSNSSTLPSQPSGPLLAVEGSRFDPSTTNGHVKSERREFQNYRNNEGIGTKNNGAHGSCDQHISPNDSVLSNGPTHLNSSTPICTNNHPLSSSFPSDVKSRSHPQPPQRSRGLHQSHQSDRRLLMMNLDDVGPLPSTIRPSSIESTAAALIGSQSMMSLMPREQASISSGQGKSSSNIGQHQQPVHDNSFQQQKSFSARSNNNRKRSSNNSYNHNNAAQQLNTLKNQPRPSHIKSSSSKSSELKRQRDSPISACSHDMSLAMTGVTPQDSHPDDSASFKTDAVSPMTDTSPFLPHVESESLTSHSQGSNEKHIDVHIYDVSKDRLICTSDQNSDQDSAAVHPSDDPSAPSLSPSNDFVPSSSSVDPKGYMDHEVEHLIRTAVVRIDEKVDHREVDDVDVDDDDIQGLGPQPEPEELVVKASASSRRYSLDEEDRFILHLTVLTLYKDQIKPQQIEIKHRLQELHCSAFLEKNFLQLYEELSEWYQVERSSESGSNNATVYLRETPNWFSGWVDMRDTKNPYPLHVWLALDQYILSLLQANNNNASSSSNASVRSGSARDNPTSSDPQGTSLTLAVADPSLPTHSPFQTIPSTPTMSIETRGGRYGMSKRLKTNGPEVFRRYSLGQVCHIVQLAVHLGLLSYDGGSLMPAACCRSLVRRLFPPVSDGIEEPNAQEQQGGVAANKAAGDAGHCAGIPHMSGTATSSLQQQLSEAMASTLEAPVTLASVISSTDDASGGQYPVVVDLDEVQRNLRILLNDEEDEEFAPMLLSQLKFRFLHKFKRRLDPVCFGFTRLSDFLAEKCSASCRLVREGGRQVLVDRVGPLISSKSEDQESSSLTETKEGNDSDKNAVELSSSPCNSTTKINESFEADDKQEVATTTSVAVKTHSATIPQTAPHSSTGPWSASSDANADRTTRGLLAVVAKHNRFHSNVSFSFWQFCAEIKRMQQPQQQQQESSRSAEQTSPPGSLPTARPLSHEHLQLGLSGMGDRADGDDSETGTLFSTAGRFTDFLFASVLRPAATDTSHAQLPDTQLAEPTMHQSSEQPSSEQQSGVLLESPIITTPSAIVVGDATASSIIDVENTPSRSPDTTMTPSNATPASLSMAHQMCRLQWFTRRPLIERQLGHRTPLSEEDVEALQDVFFSVLPPRLPLIPSSDSSRAPRPSKLRRQITAQIAQLRREVFLRSAPS